MSVHYFGNHRGNWRPKYSRVEKGEMLSSSQWHNMFSCLMYIDQHKTFLMITFPGSLENTEDSCFAMSRNCLMEEIWYFLMSGGGVIKGPKDRKQFPWQSRSKTSPAQNKRLFIECWNTSVRSNVEFKTMSDLIIYHFSMFWTDISLKLRI